MRHIVIMDNNLEIHVEGHLGTIPFFQNAKNLSDLINTVEVLKKLCLEVNPYSKISEEQKKQLQGFQVHDFFDPFAVTNKLLILLDEAEQLLKTYSKKV